MSKFKFNVNDIEISNDTLYQIIPKLDLDAPDAYIQHGTSKVLQNDIQEGAPCIFNGKKNVWDTGFYKESPCYNNMSPEKRDTLVEQLQKYIVEPFEAVHGKGILDHKNTPENNSFWDNYPNRIKNGTVFNTADVKERLNLYLTVLGFHAVNVSDKSPKASKAKYCIINKEEATSVKEGREKEKRSAVKTFFAMMENNKIDLLNILEYIGVINNPDMDDETLESIVFRFFDDPKEGFSSVTRFLETKKLNSYPKTKEEHQIHADLCKLFRDRKLIKEHGEYILNGHILGSNLKGASAIIVADTQLKTELAEALEK